MRLGKGEERRQAVLRKMKGNANATLQRKPALMGG